MKKLSLLLLIGLVAFGYNKAYAEDTPSDVVKKWYAALEKGDKKIFCDLTTNPEKAQDMFIGMKEFIKENKNRAKITKIEEVIEENIAIVATNFAVEGGYSETTLIKIDGKWKIKLSGDDD